MYFIVLIIGKSQKYPSYYWSSQTASSGSLLYKLLLNSFFVVYWVKQK